MNAKGKSEHPLPDLLSDVKRVCAAIGIPVHIDHRWDKSIVVVEVDPDAGEVSLHLGARNRRNSELGAKAQVELDHLLMHPPYNIRRREITADGVAYVVRATDARQLRRRRYLGR
jgi:hypothetical protein